MGALGGAESASGSSGVVTAVVATTTVAVAGLIFNRETVQFSLLPHLVALERQILSTGSGGDPEKDARSKDGGAPVKLEAGGSSSSTSGSSNGPRSRSPDRTRQQQKANQTTAQITRAEAVEQFQKAVGVVPRLLESLEVSSQSLRLLYGLFKTAEGDADGFAKSAAMERADIASLFDESEASGNIRLDPFQRREEMCFSLLRAVGRSGVYLARGATPRPGSDKDSHMTAPSRTDLCLKENALRWCMSLLRHSWQLARDTFLDTLVFSPFFGVCQLAAPRYSAALQVRRYLRKFTDASLAGKVMYAALAQTVKEVVAHEDEHSEGGAAALPRFLVAPTWLPWTMDLRCVPRGGLKLLVKSVQFALATKRQLADFRQHGWRRILDAVPDRPPTSVVEPQAVPALTEEQEAVLFRAVLGPWLYPASCTKGNARNSSSLVTQDRDHLVDAVGTGTAPDEISFEEKSMIENFARELTWLTLGKELAQVSPTNAAEAEASLEQIAAALAKLAAAASDENGRARDGTALIPVTTEEWFENVADCASAQSRASAETVVQATLLRQFPLLLLCADEDDMTCLHWYCDAGYLAGVAAAMDAVAALVRLVFEKPEQIALPAALEGDSSAEPDGQLRRLWNELVACAMQSAKKKDVEALVLRHVLSAQDSNQLNTPLHFALECEHEEISSLLLERAAGMLDYGLKNSDGIALKEMLPAQ
ncbi:unnamed protein product [Amoebophrya sp. A25]|nr:unnamed protein product [Amoebophrya sp. A25]|eukprot:GSA25T00016291001.1